ncbi:MAG: biopolymer transporter ExbD, partial [Bacteroidales bacterium]|nr:biopolymer transporter ExbD [Bacteroidales bacterium]
HIDGNRTAVPFGEIEPRLQEMLEDTHEPTLSLYVDKSVPMEQVVQVMNIAKRNHYKIVLATSPE